MENSGDYGTKRCTCVRKRTSAKRESLQTLATVKTLHIKQTREVLWSDSMSVQSISVGPCAFIYQVSVRFFSEVACSIFQGLLKSKPLFAEHFNFHSRPCCRS